MACALAPDMPEQSANLGRPSTVQYLYVQTNGTNDIRNQLLLEFPATPRPVGGGGAYSHWPGWQVIWVGLGARLQKYVWFSKVYARFARTYCLSLFAKIDVFLPTALSASLLFMISPKWFIVKSVIG